MDQWNGRDVVLILRMNGQQTMIEVPYVASPVGGHSPLVYVANMDWIVDALAGLGAADDPVSTDHTEPGTLISLVKRLCALTVLPSTLGKRPDEASLSVTMATGEVVKIATENGIALPVEVSNQPTPVPFPESFNVGNFPTSQVVTLNATGAAGGAKVWRSSGLTKTPVQIKAGAGRLYTMQGNNRVAAGLSVTGRTIRLYDKATAPDLTLDKPLWSLSLALGESRLASFANAGAFIQQWIVGGCCRRHSRC